MTTAKTEAKNVLGRPLESCSLDPLTGFFRDGCCQSSPEDPGLHIVCAVMTREFLVFSRSKGNDLSTPRPEFNFRGLKPGDRWCLCAARWVEAAKADTAPPVYLEGTHEAVLEYIPLDVLLEFAVTASGDLPN